LISKQKSAGFAAGVMALAVVGVGSSARAEEAPRGYKLGLQAVGCWLGGVWAEAEGAAPAERVAISQGNCRQVVAAIYGRQDRTRYEQLRAFEEGAVADLVGKVRASDASAAALIQATAAAGREAMHARRGADRVKMDIDVQSAPGKLTKDETTAATVVGEHRAIDALANLGGPLSADAHAIAVLFALDRIGAASALPKQLKFADTRDMFTLLFGEAGPPAAFDATREPPAGQWVAYLTQMATDIGHPPGATKTQPSVRRALAWAGILEGAADLLKRDQGNLSAGAVPELSRIVREVAARLESEAATSRGVVDVRG
jgi:hypothetical protein